MKSFKEKVAVITGAGSGMGRYLAVLLAKDGADVVVCDVNEATLNETVEMLRKYNVSVSSHVLDVADKDAIEEKTTALTELSGKLAERVYAQKAEAEGGEEAGPEAAAESAPADDVVDAEFEEVKDDDKK